MVYAVVPHLSSTSPSIISASKIARRQSEALLELTCSSTFAHRGFVYGVSGASTPYLICAGGLSGANNFCLLQNIFYTY